MKRLLMVFAVGLILLAFSVNSNAEIGWAGQIWPVHEIVVPEGADVNVYFQIWKGGVTDQTGLGPGISATLYYGPNGGPYTPVEMVYNTDIGNNDEYMGTIPASALNGQSEIWFYCEAYDSTDATTYTGAQDQNGNDPPFKLNITQTLDQDVLVHFFLCFPPEGDPEYDPDPGEVCITGDHDELTNWGNGIPVEQPCPDYSPRFYQVSILFHAGSNPYVQYKYRKQGCEVWEPGANHSLYIDDSAGEFYVPWIDHWGWYEGDDCAPCGIGVEQSTWGEIKAIYSE